MHTHQKFPYPEVSQRLSRLHIYDGLMMNAKRWQLAHDYHHQRQNIHYQAINQPGIVSGLGVKKLESPPNGVPEQYCDQRWIEVQPGLAIDIAGNPIIVDEPIAFRIETEAPETGTRIVHLVLSYVEPKHLDRQHSEVSNEQYRIDEKVSYIASGAHRYTSPLTEHEIELCRFRLEAGDVRLSNPADVLCPGINEIDLRDRLQAQARPQAIVRVAQVQSSDDEVSDRSRRNLTFLLRSLSALYPALQGQEHVDCLTLESHSGSAASSQYDLIYLLANETVFQDNQFEVLKSYLQQGTTLLIELAALDEDINQLIQMIQTELSVPLEEMVPREPFHELPHECCTTPFLFDALPTVEQQPIQLWVGAGVIVSYGNLSATWGLSTLAPLPRHEIRAAHEFGINLLQFACKRRQFTQLLQ